MRQIGPVVAGLFAAVLLIFFVKWLLTYPLQTQSFPDLMLHLEAGVLIYFLGSVTIDKAIKIVKGIYNWEPQEPARSQSYAEYWSQFSLLFSAFIVSAAIYISISYIVGNPASAG
jgi:hypothetical protein